MMPAVTVAVRFAACRSPPSAATETMAETAGALARVRRVRAAAAGWKSGTAGTARLADEEAGRGVEVEVASPPPLLSPLDPTLHIFKIATALTPTETMNVARNASHPVGATASARRGKAGSMMPTTKAAFKIPPRIVPVTEFSFRR